MPRHADPPLSRRERQIMDILYRRGEASVADVIRELPDPPSYSAVRALLGVLETKGHVRHRKDGTRYIYLPRKPRPHAARSALQRVLHTFFDGSPAKVVAALLDQTDRELPPEELDRLARLIDEARKEGR